MGTFTLEDRYAVIKRKEVNCLSYEEIVQLNDILQKLRDVRSTTGKQPLRCVVIESDWPEYQVVLDMLKKRVENE